MLRVAHLEGELDDRRLASPPAAGFGKEHREVGAQGDLGRVRHLDVHAREEGKRVLALRPLVLLAVAVEHDHASHGERPIQQRACEPGRREIGAALGGRLEFANPLRGRRGVVAEAGDHAGSRRNLDDRLLDAPVRGGEDARDAVAVLPESVGRLVAQRIVEHVDAALGDRGLLFAREPGARERRDEGQQRERSNQQQPRVPKPDRAARRRGLVREEAERGKSNHPLDAPVAEVQPDRKRDGEGSEPEQRVQEAHRAWLRSTSSEASARPGSASVRTTALETRCRRKQSDKSAWKLANRSR